MRFDSIHDHSFLLLIVNGSLLILNTLEIVLLLGQPVMHVLI